MIVVAACLLAGGVSAAQPAPANKGDAKSLMQSGVRLLDAKDYLGALAVFKDAYARFPSAKILLNIGTTFTLLERKADAANAYQRYLDSPDSDPAKRGDVQAAIADLDRAVGRLEITVTPEGAEVQVNDGDWQSARSVKLYRVPHGAYTVRARKDKFQSSAKSASLNIGETAAVALALVAMPEEPTRITTNPRGGDVGLIDVGVTQKEDSRARLAGIVVAHLDIPRGGGAARVGLAADLTPQLQVQAAALVGPKTGAYAGASFAFLSGGLRPFVAAGMPVFFSNGARFGVRGAGGVEVVFTRHFSLLAELGAEVLLNPEDNIIKTVFIPAIGAAGRL
jgi:hypothetical protein